MIPHQAVFPAAVVLLGLLTVAGSAKKGPISPESYVGDSKCLSCHADKQTYLQTAHHLTSTCPHSSPSRVVSAPVRMCSRLPIPTCLSGWTPLQMDLRRRLSLGHLRMRLPIWSELTSDWFRKKGTNVSLLERRSAFRAARLVLDELASWVDSPGYRDDPELWRPVPPRCLECHASYFVSLTPESPSNLYKKTGFILGISCKVSRPGREYVARHASGQAASAGKPSWFPEAIPGSAAKYPRDVSCGHRDYTARPRILVHSGGAFARPDQLGIPDPMRKIDVHGNQVMLLQRSRCSQSSPAMSCSTCHNVHVPQRDEAAFSSHCLSCHKAESCGEFKKTGSTLPQIASILPHAEAGVEPDRIWVRGQAG